ncbi:hypothetical protein [Sphingobium sp. Ant17]|uniref:hypothetical protein n=1 Tax=Sphingobium sp. Ant17 TaxID=1461752 RepID=UPI0004AEA5E2|nr:hypothetical protein [Sphingobium sp. Ant17]
MTVAASVPLNQECVCITLDRGALSDALTRETGDPAFSASLVETRPHLFSDVAVFISAAQLEAMQCIVAAIETVVRHPAYRAAVLDWAPASAQRDFGRAGCSWVMIFTWDPMDLP